MLISYRNGMRAAIAQIAEAERRTRVMIGDVKGREEKYTEVFRTHLETLLNGFSEGGVTWHVVTYTTDKQSGQESEIGADLVVALAMNLDGVTQSKGFLVQAKVNKNVRSGVSVDSIAKLRSQCHNMTELTNDAYVFAYGQQNTKVLKALNVLTEASLSEISDKGIVEFFEDVMMCWLGDPGISARNHSDLENLVKAMEARSGALIEAVAEKHHRLSD